ncbi:MAG: AraC family transcriptional regulator [Liquorilactobacillus ghanensis]|uniref:helix-turn-helix domain-containing protein n=1 Tax=Liquorilactobacillus ghanensis TaxID=399370 RepID=UPI0039EBBE73
MKLEHELIKKTVALPFNVFTFHARDLSRLIPQHWHQSTELINCQSGQLDVWIEGKHYRMSKGDLLIINPNTVHSTQSPIANHVLIVQLPLTFLQELTENQFNRNFRFNVNTVKDHRDDFTVVRNSLIRLADIYENKCHEWPLVDKVEEEALILTVISNILSLNAVYTFTKSNSHHSSSLQLMNQVTHFINNHVSEQLSLHRVAQEFNYSDSYFSRIFKQSFNMNFHDFVTSIRLNDAVSKLVNSDQSVDFIAQSSGFITYRNFYNAFCRVYQVSPNEYRKNSRQYFSI